MSWVKDMQHEHRFDSETYPFSWPDNRVPQSLNQLAIFSSVPPRRDTSPDYAGSRPSKRIRAEGHCSVGNTPGSVALPTYSNSFLLQRETESEIDGYFPSRSFGTGAQTVGQAHGGNWSADEQEYWSSTANSSFTSKTSCAATSTSDCPPHQLIDPNTVGFLSHASNYAVFKLPIPDVGSGRQPTLAPTTSSTHFSFGSPPSNDTLAPVPFESLSYDRAVDRPLPTRLPLPALFSLNIPQAFDIAPVSVSGIASAFPSHEGSTACAVQDTPRHSTPATSPSPNNDDDWPTNPTDVGSSSPSTAPAIQSPPSTVPARKKRRSFDKIDKAARKETSNTRKIGACLRCRLQRVRCSDPGPAPDFLCRACASVSRLSKKTIYRIACCRTRLNHGALHRSDGLYYTVRFTHTQVVDVASNGRIIMAEVTQGICKIPIRLRVRRFEPREGDVINRRYCENGIVKEQYLQPYCLANVEETANEFKAYLNDNAFDGLEEAAKGSDELVRVTFRMIANECRATDSGDAKTTELRKFLRSFVRMWFALRHESSVGWLCGEETLGSQAGEGDTPGPAIPRMIVAQFDSIRHEKVFKVLVPSMLKRMEEYLWSQKGEAWFVVYLASFLLLHQVSKCSADRARWARDNACDAMPLETRYGPINHPFTALIENIQECANTLLIHWQFFKKCDLMNIPWESPGKTQLKALKPYQLAFMKHTVGLVKRKKAFVPTSPSEGCWDHELFWILQLFGSAPEHDRRGRWNPPDRFSRALHTVGRHGGWPYYS